MGNKQVNILMVGIGGYAELYFEVIQELQDQGSVRLRAYFDPMAERAQCWPEIRQMPAARLSGLEEVLQGGLDIDLAIVCSPIAYHADQTCALLDAGINVLCEKPIAATIPEVQRMLEARDRSGRFLEIGYQWSFSPTISRLKADVLAGRLGAPRQFLTRVGWPRTNKYYGRNDWAGQISDRHGHVINDSPLTNATAHFLHNMLYVLGPKPGLSASPTALTGECYRANPIENFDAACCRIETLEGAEILFYTAHCVEKADGPVFRFVFEDAVVKYEANTGKVVARLKDGRVWDYGDPNHDRHRHLRQCVQSILTGEAHAANCGPEAAMAHTYCVEGIQAVPIQPFPSAMITHKPVADDETLTCVRGLNEAMQNSYAVGTLFSEQGLPWTRPGQRVALGTLQLTR